MNFIQRTDIRRMIDSGVFPGRVNWLGTDKKSRFQDNLRRDVLGNQIQEFVGRTLNYTLNSEGFRAPEFTDVTWSDSVAVIGCSMVFGDGLDDGETLTAQLSEIIGRPVINLGITGASSELCLYNSQILRDHYGEPAQLIVIWPTVDRITEFHAQGCRCHGVWLTRDSEAIARQPRLYQQIRSQAENYGDLADIARWTEVYKTVNAEARHRDFSHVMNTQLISAIWGSGLKQYTWSPATQALTGCELLTWEPGDLARDLIHPGRATIRQWAEQIAGSLQP